MLVNGEHNFVLVGDVNARTGQLQTFDEELSGLLAPFSRLRGSRDPICNGRGRRLVELCDNVGLVILNGRAPVDQLGELTCISARGQSVIDLLCVQMTGLSLVRGFSVLPEAFSDHLPLTFLLKGPKQSLQEGELFPMAIKWTANDELHFRRKVLRCLDDLPVAGGCAAQDDLKRIISRCADRRITTGGANKVVFHKPWFSYECLRLRKQVFGLLRLHQRSNSDFVLLQYKAASREYKTLCATKKKNYNLNMAARFVEATEGERFWKLVDEFRIRGPSQTRHIGMPEWILYFSDLYNPQAVSSLMAYAPPEVRVESLDAAFTLAELRGFLGSIKRNKAPGLDRIPLEFYLNAPDSFLSLLVVNFNCFFRGGDLPEGFRGALVRSGGRLARGEKWFLGGQPITCANSYKYLGMELRFDLGLSNHFVGKSRLVRFGIGSVWSRLFMANDRPVYVSNLKMSAGYIGKVLRQPITRFTKLTAEEVIRKRIGWAKVWSSKVLELDPNADPFDPSLFPGLAKSAVCREIARHSEFLRTRPAGAQYHLLFQHLDHTGKQYISFFARLFEQVLRISLFWTPGLVYPLQSATKGCSDTEESHD
ncbi:hypothetical protein GE061_005089 [Apolygus lucorum]|uniref:Endonuclease/exonuclease/phosphatase domain-containing protein n=1 Tax=Apolygus lucorum TaxID=248454 RepID=A0A8S9WXW1_APOLU|nr:hypothetical protein GE061_005089 [Apolygus lucorum]